MEKAPKVASCQAETIQIISGKHFQASSSCQCTYIASNVSVINLLEYKLSLENVFELNPLVSVYCLKCQRHNFPGVVRVVTEVTKTGLNNVCACASCHDNSDQIAARR